MKLSSRPIEPRAPTQTSCLLEKRGFSEGVVITQCAHNLLSLFLTFSPHSLSLFFPFQLLRYKEKKRIRQEEKRTNKKQIQKELNKRLSNVQANPRNKNQQQHKQSPTFVSLTVKLGPRSPCGKAQL